MKVKTNKYITGITKICNIHREKEQRAESDRNVQNKDEQTGLKLK